MAKNKEEPLGESLAQFTRELIGDLRDLRAGKITNADARARAMLAHEILRSAHLAIEGMRYVTGSAKQIEG